MDSAALDALLKHCRSLRELRLSRTLQQPHVPARPWTAESLANLAAFKAKVLAEKPGANVSYEYKEVFDPHAQ